MSTVRSVVVGLVLVCGSAAFATPVTLNFTRITSNSSENVASQMTCVVDLFQAASGGNPEVVSFRFENAVGIQSSVSEVYFDDGPLLGIASIDQKGASFIGGSASPVDLPGGQNLTPAFNATRAFSADAQGNPSEGLDVASDHLEMRFNLINNKTFDDIIASINDGSLRIGLHVRSIGAGQNSDGFVNTPPTVVIPLPGAAGMSLAGLLGLAAVRRRRGS
jgi:hypothetical protein